METPSKLVVFSGIQPTGKLHIGNYIGALSVWAGMQESYDNIFCIVDLHALTIPESVNPSYLKAKTRELAGLYLACGIDPAASSIFIQSHVPEHSELTWILNCVTPIGWLERMTQYKVKSAQMESVSTALLDYPVLQASDILLYDTNLVPVGEDQRQHIELTRDIAERFGRMFGEVFVIPEAFVRSSGARIMGLDDPTLKMSKSLGEMKKDHSVGLLDPPGDIRQAVMRAVTDAGNEVRFEKASPGVLNLMTIYEALSGEPRQTLESRFEAKGYGFLKKDLVDLIESKLDPVRKSFAEITSDPSYIEEVLDAGAARVRPIAQRTLGRVKEKLGLG